MPARGKRPPNPPSACRHNKAAGPLAVGLYLAMLVLLMVGASMYFRYHTEWQRYQQLRNFFGALAQNNAEASVGVPVEESPQAIFNITPECREQWDNYMEGHTFLYEPQRFGHREFGLPDISFTEDEKNWFEALGCSESKYHHFDPDNNPYAATDHEGRPLITSGAGCVSIYQGCNLSICPKELWSELKTNIWCGAKLFRQLLDQFPGDMDMVLACYKDAVVKIDTDGDGYKETYVYDQVTGNVIPDPELDWQVQTVRDLVTKVP